MPTRAVRGWIQVWLGTRCISTEQRQMGRRQILLSVNGKTDFLPLSWVIHRLYVGHSYPNQGHRSTKCWAKSYSVPTNTLVTDHQQPTAIRLYLSSGAVTPQLGENNPHVQTSMPISESLKQGEAAQLLCNTNDLWEVTEQLEFHPFQILSYKKQADF